MFESKIFGVQNPDLSVGFWIFFFENFCSAGMWNDQQNDKHPLGLFIKLFLLFTLFCIHSVAFDSGLPQPRKDFENIKALCCTFVPKNSCVFVLNLTKEVVSPLPPQHCTPLYCTPGNNFFGSEAPQDFLWSFPKENFWTPLLYPSSLYPPLLYHPMACFLKNYGKPRVFFQPRNTDERGKCTDTQKWTDFKKR